MLTKGVIHFQKLPSLSNLEHWNRCDASQRKNRSLGGLLILVSLFSTVLSSPAFAGTPASPQGPNVISSVIRGAEVVETVFPGEFSEDLRSIPRLQAPLPGQAIEINPRQQHGGPTVSPPLTIPKVDPLLQSLGRGSFRTQNALRAPSSFDTPLLNFAGQGFSGFVPPDTVGDAGPSHYIQMINGPTGGASFVIYNKSGGILVAQTALETLATSGACITGGGDPIVLYDPLADRWLMSEFANTGNHLCVYISKTNDPVAGGWWTYDFTTPNFPDYPKYAVWPDAYYVSSNENNPAAYALDRTKMLAGLPATSLRFTAPSLPGFGFQALTPADLDGATPPPAGAPGYFMRQVDDELLLGAVTPNDYLEIWAFHADFVTPANSTFTKLPNVLVADFDSDLCGVLFVGCIPQPGTPTTLDPIREVIMWRVQYRNFAGAEKLVGNFAVDVNGLDHAGIRWFELNKTVPAGWLLAQQGTYSPDAAGRWMGSIAMDGCRNIALGYSVSSSTVFPGIRYAGRLASDAPGTLPQGENSIVAGLSSQTFSIRWGDYSSMNVDPADDRTFWYTNEYVVSGFWTTRIASFQFPSCGPKICDADSDGDIDKLDLALISKARGQTAQPGDQRDANGDGKIDVRDVKICIPQCTRPNCFTQSPPFPAEG
ncbi:MAG: dockerin type I domain-containing protein [Methylobacter sp.]